MDRDKRKQQIIERVGGHGPALTADGIAKLLPSNSRRGHMVKSPHLVGMLEEMTNAGLLVCQWSMHENKTLARYFSLPEQVVKLL